MAVKFEDFLGWEKTTRDTIDFKKIYCDMAGSVTAGLVLSELVYWYLPDKEGNSNKLRCRKKGKLWIAVPRWQWWDRTRLSPDQADRALKTLADSKLIEKQLFRFKSFPTVHIRILEDKFMEIWDAIMKNPPTNPYKPVDDEDTDEYVDDVEDFSEINDGSPSDFASTRSVVATTRSVVAKSGKSLTENTKENKDKELIPAADAAGTVNFSNSTIQDTKSTGSIQSVPGNKQSMDSLRVVNALPEVTYLVPPDQPTDPPIVPAVQTRIQRISDWEEWVRAVLRVFDKEHLFDGSNYKDRAIGHFVKVASELRKIAESFAEIHPEKQRFCADDVLLMGKWLKSRVITTDAYRNTSPQIFLSNIAEFIWHQDEIKVDAARGKFDEYEHMHFGCAYGKYEFDDD